MKTRNDFRLSVIVPAYTEKESLLRNVRRVLKDSSSYLLELIIIVSPRADPETLSICRDLEKTDRKITCLIQKHNPGLGRALREAFERVKGTHVQILYADSESDPAAIPLFIETALRTDADLVIASRWMAGGNVRHYPPVRYFFNRAYQLFFRMLYRTRLHDLTFGFNLIKREVINNIVWQGVKHEIATEMVLKALRLKYRIEEIPVVWVRRSEGKSKLQLTRYLYYPFMAFLIILTPREWLSRHQSDMNRGQE